MIYLNLFIPSELLTGISRTNLHRWRQQDPDRYHGSELSRFAATQYEVLREFSEDRKAQQLFKAYLKLTVCLVSIISGTKAVVQVIREQKEKVVNAVLIARRNLDWETCLTLFNISRSTFDGWAWKVKYPCHQSWLQFCNRRYPQQLTKTEISKMEKLLLSDRFRDWPVVSIAFYALREKIVVASTQTWYRYARLLSIKRNFRRRRPKYKGIKSTSQNEYWHADITIIKTLDGVKHYLYLLSDNFSRKILSWKLADRVCGEIRRETIAEAAGGIQIPLELELITDGGPENCNLSVYQFCNANGIAPKVAMKDIPWSNSLIEAINKIVKYNYLKHREIRNGDHLLSELDKIIHDYNEIRPHCALNGLTPAEVYAGRDPNLPNFRSVLAKAKSERVAENQKNLCKPCQRKD